MPGSCVQVDAAKSARISEQHAFILNPNIIRGNSGINQSCYNIQLMLERAHSRLSRKFKSITAKTLAKFALHVYKLFIAIYQVCVESMSYEVKKKAIHVTVGPVELKL